MSLGSSLAKTNTSVSKVSSKLTSNGSGGSGKLGGIIGSASGIQKNVAGSVAGVGNIVAKAAGALGFKDVASSLTGESTVKYSDEIEPSSNNGLKTFYNTFNGLSQNRINHIDPQASFFECMFRFFPNGIDTTTVIKKQNPNNGKIEKEETTKNSYENSVITRIMQNILFFSIKPEIYQASEDFNPATNTVDKQIIKSYNGDINVEFHIFIQNVSLPTIEVESESITTAVGKFPIPGNIVKPSDNSFTMDIVNLEIPVIENIFYPWMRETTLPQWVYPEQPYTTANISFDFNKHNNVKYNFLGCKPTSIMLTQPNQQYDSRFTRTVTFSFDLMTIECDDKYTKSEEFQKFYKTLASGDKNGGSSSGVANSALFSATNSFKL